MANAFVYSELHTSNLDAAGGFYQKLFDWKLKPNTETPFPYTGVTSQEGHSAGMMGTEKSAQSFWLTYVSVDDLRASTQRARELGATILQEDVEVPEQGRFTVLKDPTGATLALWQKAKAK
jgi:predicted enzyme related to lactoylglutathione lyase